MTLGENPSSSAATSDGTPRVSGKVASDSTTDTVDESSDDDAMTPVEEEADTTQLKNEEIRKQRHFRSENTFWRALTLPVEILDLMWYPLKLGLHAGEKHQIDVRLQEIFYFNDEHTAGWFPNASIGGELGDAGGIALFHNDLFEKQHEIGASFLMAGDEEFDLRGSYMIPENDTLPFATTLNTEFLRDDEVEIFVATDNPRRPQLGIDTAKGDETDFTLRTLDTRVTANKDFGDSLQMGLYLRGELSKASRTGTTNLTGLDGLNEEIGFAAPGVDVSWDRRDDPNRPARGWFLKANVESPIAPSKTEFGSRYGYYDYSVEGQAILPLHGPHRVLVFTQRFRRVDPFGSTSVPFYRLPVLDLNNGLRAFERNRFQDRGAIVSNIEYRYPVWRTWDAFLFVDGGQTFDEYSDVALDKYEYAGGGGVRLLTEQNLQFLLQVGFGSEGNEVIFSFERVLN